MFCKIVFTEGEGMPKIDVFFRVSLKNRRLMTKGGGGVKNLEKLMKSFMNGAKTIEAKVRNILNVRNVSNKQDQAVHM